MGVLGESGCVVFSGYGSRQCQHCGVGLLQKSINHLNYRAPEESHATEELVGYKKKKVFCFSKVPELHPFCSSGKRNMLIKMSTEHWWIDTDRGKPR